jgi:adenylate cyclase
MEQFIDRVTRSARGPACAPTELSIAEVEHWLLFDANKQPDLLLVFEEFAWRMVAAELPIDQYRLYIGTLHPLLRGFAWTWRKSDGFCEELKVRRSVIGTKGIRRSPLWKLFSTERPLRCCPQDRQAQDEFPIMAEYAAMGFTDYVGILLGADQFRHVMAYATKRSPRFTDGEMVQIERLLALFALHVERHIAVRIADNALRTYLGRLAATKVLSGKIKRGHGESVRAIIWVSDLREYTALSGRLNDDELIQLINIYFEIFADSVLSHQGEVLKFIGDGILAIFPFVNDVDGVTAAEKALAAAEMAQARLEDMNKLPRKGMDPGDHILLRAGIALHEGEVFFGNVGSPERLDFTVVGSAVNEASRIEALNKMIGRGILVSEQVAQRFEGSLELLGQYELRGVAEPMAIYAPIVRSRSA